MWKRVSVRERVSVGVLLRLRLCEAGSEAGVRGAVGWEGHVHSHCEWYSWGGLRLEWGGWGRCERGNITATMSSERLGLSEAGTGI